VKVLDSDVSVAVSVALEVDCVGLDVLQPITTEEISKSKTIRVSNVMISTRVGVKII
jgi:hypothetical protein